MAGHENLKNDSQILDVAPTYCTPQSTIWSPKKQETFPTIPSQSEPFASLCLADLLSNPDHLAKVQFAFKLGYTEHELLTVLRQVGPDAKKDQILGDLVKLTAAKSSASNVNLNEEDSLQEIMDYIILEKEDDNLRHIVIDGSNVAMIHGNKEVFSCFGIKLAVDYFIQRGHKDITVFVPQWRKEVPGPDTPIKNQEILFELEKKKFLVFTPARRIGGKRVVCYDDRYIIKLAAETGGAVVSNDNYRDLLSENPEFKKAIEERLLMYSFVNDRFMPPDDPLGRHGPTIDNFLRKDPLPSDILPQICPYQKKCTYGNKCKYYHPERGLRPQKSVSEKLAEEARVKLQDVRERKLDENKGKSKEGGLDNTTEFTASTKERVQISQDPERKRAQDERLDKYRLRIQEIEKKEMLHAAAKKLPGWSHRLDIPLNVCDHSSIPITIGFQVPPISARYDDGSHLSLAKQLSQEESIKSQADVISHGPDSLPIATVGSQVEELHRKLDRKLNLNQTEDNWTCRKSLYRPYMSMSTNALDHALFVDVGRPPAVEHSPYSHSSGGKHSVLGRTQSSRNPRHINVPEHVQLSRMASDPYPQIQQHNSNNLNVCAPDRSNSTSDPMLNVHQQPYVPQHSSDTSVHDRVRVSKQQNTHYHFTSRVNPSRYSGIPSVCSSRHLPVTEEYPSSVDQGKYSFQPPRFNFASAPIPNQSSFSLPEDSPILYDDPRFQLYYHLCCIFPEDRVRIVMNRYPNELNPQKICAYILEK